MFVCGVYGNGGPPTRSRLQQGERVEEERSSPRRSWKLPRRDRAGVDVGKHSDLPRYHLGHISRRGPQVHGTRRRRWRAFRKSLTAVDVGDCTFGNPMSLAVSALCAYMAAGGSYASLWSSLVVVFGQPGLTPVWTAPSIVVERRMDPKWVESLITLSVGQNLERHCPLANADRTKLISHARSPCSLRGRVPAHASPATVCYTMLSCTRTAGPRSKMNVFMRNLEARFFPLKTSYGYLPRRGPSTHARQAGWREYPRPARRLGKCSPLCTGAVRSTSSSRAPSDIGESVPRVLLFARAEAGLRDRRTRACRPRSRPHPPVRRRRRGWRRGAAGETPTEQVERAQ